MIPAEVLVCSASFCISLATTANPRPASPALAASILAFSERRFVWLAIEAIRSTASWILTTDSFVFMICAAILSKAADVISLVAASSLTISDASLLLRLICSDVSESCSTLFIMFETFSHIPIICCEEFSMSLACAVAPCEISLKAPLTFSAASCVLSALSFSSIPLSESTFDIFWRSTIVCCNVSRNLLILSPNCENSSFPLCFTLIPILPCAILSSDFLNDLTFESILLLITIVMNNNINAEAKSATIIITNALFFTAWVLASTAFARLLHASSIIAFAATFAVFISSILSSNATMLSYALLITSNFARESSAASLLVENLGIFNAISSRTVCICPLISTTSFPSTTSRLYSSTSFTSWFELS